MRFEALSSRTWLLAALAGWAMLVWLLAVMGLGGRIAQPAKEDGTATVLAMPTLPEPASERLLAFDRYSGIAAHPLFSMDRLPKAFQLVADAAPAATEDVRLTGVLITPGLQLATLQTTNGASLRLRLDGPEVAGWRLLSLQPRAAMVTGPGGVRSLALQTYEGTRAGQGRPSGFLAPASAASSSMQPGAGAHVTPAQPAPMASTVATQQQIDEIRRRIEERRQRMNQQGQGEAPVPSDTP
ncbi:hypothetical protein [Pseudoxanthomonas suwonensis]|uniref:General secretion pathway protein GspN n=1 Tax=Pseudoxanthomonas suwonensis TaxID=314722 RepID=A0A0E3Z3R2_9GAMM|nr:hypothetical protein [Pseudoxanthomonas suwonensis]AKC88054.1 hypothetical protein WQ53_16045 [Pseudoxanthomonas suwonensis]